MKPRSVNAKSKKENSSHFADFVIEDEEILDILNIVRTDNSAFVRYSLFEGIEVIDFESRMGILEKEFVELYWSSLCCLNNRRMVDKRLNTFMVGCYESQAR